MEGRVAVGATLTADPHGATVNYQWQRANDKDGEYNNIVGATNKTYTLTETDKDKWVRVQVTGTGRYKGTIESEPVNPTETAMEIVVDLPEFVENEPGAFTVRSIPNEDGSKLVRVHFTLPEGVTVKYQEGGEGEWIPLVDVFGPAGGFQLDDITTPLQGTFAAAGMYTVKVEFKVVGTGEVLASKDITAVVITQEQTEALGEINEYLRAYDVNQHYNEAPGKLEQHLSTLELDVSKASDYDKLQIEGGTNRKTAVFYDLSHEDNIGEGYTVESLAKIFNSIVMVRTATQTSTDAVNNAVGGELADLNYIETLQTAFENAQHTTHSDKTFIEKKQELTDLLGRYGQLGNEAKAAVRARIIDKEFLSELKNLDGAFKRSEYSIDALAAALTEVETITHALGEINAYLQAYDVNQHYNEAPGKLESHLATLGLDVAVNSAYDKLQIVGGTNRKTAVFYDLSHKDNIDDGYTVASLKETFNSIVIVRTATQASTDAINSAVTAEKLDDLGYIETLQTAFAAANHTTHSDKTFVEKKQELTDLLDRYSALDDTEKAAVRARIIDKEFLSELKNLDGAFKRSEYSIDALAAALTEMEEAED